ncbi:30S ribosomal protein S12 methylthiotransferase RimO [Peptoniphilus sp. oral taxon 386]|uniref:30S ribosomal protein S12 methylthiotransferase RimO n=1 Tax=Peptoniphilus sp. oral taxon 386 TaxID=652713 RepID=UPI0001DA9D36|nr:30S ribosomal protein S12 methylthiotransferase RimO [Peptoniphilus sp. oral taxon 386]EFI42282.1 ribosomal protein S12 methylthiotransferase RimO [Peptoniphilus sp. oral taxon 386 str. F0131]
MNSIHFITLGCSKNEVDTSQMQSILDSKKYIITNNVNDANVIIINTCGFIDAAKEESVDTIIEAAKYKDVGKCKKLILAGCLAQRYSKELMEEIPEVDAILGTGNIININNILDSAFNGERIVKVDNINDKYIEGIKKSKVSVTEYVKISEGCNNNCTYCIIPKLRGRNRSRKIEDIYDEVKYLVNNGTREVILIAQNTTDYGIDNYKEYKLKDLVKKLSEIKDLKWIRLMYLYPDNFTDELIDEFKNNDKLLNYVDIPLQHISDNILSKMNRKTNRNNISELLFKLRNNIPNIIIRTTFIVGFPGEENSDFNELNEFIEENKFDKLGAFIYSREEDTPAFNMNNQIQENVKQKRLDILMSTQISISENKLSSNIGNILEVLIEEIADNETYVGRSYMDAPEIDGVVYVKSKNNLKIGSFYNVKITDYLEYDLIGDAI